jgi:hypothetical protein
MVSLMLDAARTSRSLPESGTHCCFTATKDHVSAKTNLKLTSNVGMVKSILSCFQPFLEAGMCFHGAKEGENVRACALCVSLSLSQDFLTGLVTRPFS